GRKIAWVSWAKVCRPKTCGGLGIRDLRAGNLALLGKWRWRIIAGGQGIWREILLARYGSLFPSQHLGGPPNGFTRASLWWKNVSLLGDSTVACSDWFSKGVSRKIGNGSDTTFWFDPWVGGGVPLKIRFQRWKMELSLEEVDLVRDLLQVVTQSPTLGVQDVWVWKYDPSGTYYVRSAYLTLTGAEAISDPNSLLSRVWKSWAPSKVIVFSWQLLQDIVPTRQNLLRRQ
ncbi:ribonuclease H protein, partial [Trifolium medium]|nr:ribonuclease H protein [Trifolium medium]